jgi:hypothetical protein
MDESILSELKLINKHLEVIAIRLGGLSLSDCIDYGEYHEPRLRIIKDLS